MSNSRKAQLLSRLQELSLILGNPVAYGVTIQIESKLQEEKKRLIEELKGYPEEATILSSIEMITQPVTLISKGNMEVTLKFLNGKWVASMNTIKESGVHSQPTVILDAEGKPVAIEYSVCSSETQGIQKLFRHALVIDKKTVPVVKKTLPSASVPTWICARCGSLNYIGSLVCRQCNHPRPEEPSKDKKGNLGTKFKGLFK